jgi:multiple sugar transport system permease protein
VTADDQPRATGGAHRRHAAVTTARRRAQPHPSRFRWLRFAIVLIVTMIALVPIAVVILLALRPGTGSPSHAVITSANLVQVFRHTSTLEWLRNSLAVTLATVFVSVVVAAPAGYVLSRGRGRAISGYALLLFVIQALPVITSVIPLFILFIKLHLVDSLVGLVLIYAGASISVATWMMAAYLDSIPVSLEQAAWLDGASVFGGFVRVVLPNALPGILSTAIFTYLVSWNDYLVAVVFIRSQNKYTLALGQQLFVPDWGPAMAIAVVLMAPPVILFAALHRFFSVGGIGGAVIG